MNTTQTLKQGDKISLVINNLGTNAEGVGVYGDYTVFVPFALPGETVSCRVDFAKRNVAHATLLQVETSSSQRVQPSCNYYGKCGGCTLQHADFDTENAFKRNLVQGNLQKLGKLQLDVEPTIAGTRYAYRNKISLPVGGKAGNVKIGMYKRGSHDIVAVNQCVLTDSWANDLIAIFTTYFNTIGAVPYNQQTFKGEIRHVTARFINGQLLATIVSNGAYKRSLAPLIKLLSDRFANFGLFINVNTLKNNVILGDVTQHVYGLKHITSTENGVTYQIQPDSFFQVNDEIKAQLYAHVKELVSSENPDVLIECFSGVGLLTAELVSDDYDTYAIEIVPSAVDDANAMKQANGIARLQNICGDVNVELPKLMHNLAGKNTVMVVDPPRKGVGEKICQLILDNPPQKLVYVSCDSATLARDLAILSQGYTVELVQPYNMFPNTAHVETLVCLTRRS